jgi:hypothetical protein
MGLRISDAITQLRTAALACVCLGVCGVLQLPAEDTRQPCPVVIEQVSLAYSHEGNPSIPRLQIRFANASTNSIAHVTFQLALLDDGGYPHDYPDDLTSHSPLEPGKRKNSAWTLRPESVDIHRSGEVLVVKRVDFADRTSWHDDGSQSCKLAVDFHAR